MIRSVALAAGAFAFCLVAILNCGGYRYGVGDQAFYIPAVTQHLNPELFPRDRAILHAQDRFMLYDDAIAAFVRATGVSVQAVFFAGYLAGLALLFGAIVAIGRVMYKTWLGVAMLAALLTLRHRITQTGANSLESYFQPRMLAFALGAWAIAAYLRGRLAATLALVTVAFAIHPTTAMWFAIWIGVALLVSERSWRVPLAALAAIGLVLAVWAVTLGPLRGHLDRMDPLWASAMAGKDYIFPSDWNASFWLVNLSYLAVACRGVCAAPPARHRGAARDWVAGRSGRARRGLSHLVAPHARRHCACAAAPDVARVLDARFSRGDVSCVAVCRSATLAHRASRCRCDRDRCRHRPRRVRVGRGARRQPDRANRISAG